MARNGDEAEATLQSHDLAGVFRAWDAAHTTPHYDPVPVLIRLAELFEDESQVFMRKDPDPFDERHPSRTDPECELGRMLKLLFRKEQFMSKLMNDYLRDNFYTRQTLDKSSFELNVAACRLILVIMPGLETSAVFQDSDNLINRLYAWATNSLEPLQSYATGLLAAAMEGPDINTSFREQNGLLIPVMINRLHQLQKIKPEINFSQFCSNEKRKLREISNSDTSLEAMDVQELSNHLGGGSAPSSPSNAAAPPLNSNLISKFKNFNNLNALLQNELNSNTQDSKTYIRNVIPFHPPTTATCQMLILRYLTSLGEYQEFLGHAFENNTMQIILNYIDSSVDQKDACLTFEALKYLASLLCHKKFALEFVNQSGLEKLLLVPRPSIAATGVAISLYYLAYCEDATERICCMPQETIAALVNYVLWLLGCPHDSGRCHATMFFGLCLQFKVILDEFDRQDGFRKLYNVISVLPLLSSSDEITLNDDEECAARQLVRHVVMTMKKYMESHLYYKYAENLQGNSALRGIASSTFVVRAPKCTPELIGDMVTMLQEVFPIRSTWFPVHKLLEYGGIQLLLKIIAMAYEWNFSRRFEVCRAETVKSALDILAICCVIPRVLQLFCERIELPDLTPAAGINVILHSAEGEIVADPEVQKSALSVLVHCVCAPIHRPSNMHTPRFGSTSKKKQIAIKINEDIVQKIWESVRSNNGIIVLLSLMQTKAPITDADCIRGMACRALAGLARCETVRQIISKLPLFTNGQLQGLMRDPILQEKRVEHVQFQKYALELMERVSGKRANSDVSLADIHRANVVAQTRIQYNEQQLLQLIQQDLLERGLVETATALQKEANLSSLSVAHQQQRQLAHLSPYTFRSPSINRSRLRTRNIEFNPTPENPPSSTSTNTLNHVPTPEQSTAPVSEDVNGLHTPIKLIKRHEHQTPGGVNQTAAPVPHSSTQRSLQKSISVEPFTVGGSATAAAGTCLSHSVTLDTIVTEYLKNQHALCKHPMSTCSQFDLFKPHKCPDPRPNKRSGLCLNFSDRLFRREAGFTYSKQLDRRLIHSHFNVTRTLRSQEAETFFTCGDFTPCSSKLVLGCYTGDVKVFNINDSEEEFSHGCHESGVITGLSMSRCGKFMITSTTWQPALSCLWAMGDREFINKLQLTDEEHCEFANMTPNWILGTKAEAATIYDLNTGKSVSTFKPSIFNQYTKNKATFCPTDELIWSDGVLWDVKGGIEIHKFDKLNQTISGVFHPNNLEVVSNTEVWDMRTFHLLRTVPSLDQCRVIFSPQNVIYAITAEQESRSEDGYPYESSYKVLDAYDYSSIATVDVKRTISDLVVNKYGSQIAIVENQGGFDSIQESMVRLYNVGRKKNTEDAAQEEEEEEEEETDDSDESIDSLSDDDAIEGGLEEIDLEDDIMDDPARPGERRGRNSFGRTRRLARQVAQMLQDGFITDEDNDNNQEEDGSDNEDDVSSSNHSSAANNNTSDDDVLMDGPGGEDDGWETTDE